MLTGPARTRAPRSSPAAARRWTCSSSASGSTGTPRPAASSDRLRARGAGYSAIAAARLPEAGLRGDPVAQPRPPARGAGALVEAGASGGVQRRAVLRVQGQGAALHSTYTSRVASLCCCFFVFFFCSFGCTRAPRFLAEPSTKLQSADAKAAPEVVHGRYHQRMFNKTNELSFISKIKAHSSSSSAPSQPAASQGPEPLFYNILLLIIYTFS